MPVHLIQTGVIHLGSVVLSVGVGVVLARFLGPGEFGLYAFALAIVTLSVVLVEFGLPTVMLREAAARREDPAMIRAIASRLAVVVLVNGAVAVGLLIGSWLIARVAMRDAVPLAPYGPVLGIGLALLPVLALVKLGSGTLRGTGAMLTGQTTEFVVRNLLLSLAALATFAIWPDARTAPSAMAIHVCAALATLAITGAALARVLPRPPKAARPDPVKAPAIRPRLRSGFFFLLGSSALIVNTQLDVVMVGSLLGAEDVGLYRVAAQAAILTSFGLQIVQVALAPRFSRAWREGDLAAMKRLWLQGAAFGGGLALIALAAFASSGRVLLATVFGDAYSGSFTVLLILCVGYAANAACGPVGVMLSMANRERLVAACIWATLLGNVALNFTLIPLFGLQGAAIATAVAVAGLQGAMAIVAYRTLNG
ncbi:oligosaccharide flippase family protein [Jannaschia sp. LMIT008]|uniref:oligosaccharide flippase family protein n=1 Tax=Jannaschia maritima TaxID=3032585 RepID=UPI0028111FD7|nr:oligosaccharide flippase family protein [Jannaschia sp. LMIT008]